MEDRQWGYQSRGPRDRFRARHPWPGRDETGGDDTAAYDADAYDADAYDRAAYDAAGYGRAYEGHVYEPDAYDTAWYDDAGYDTTGYDTRARYDNPPYGGRAHAAGDWHDVPSRWHDDSRTPERFPGTWAPERQYDASWQTGTGWIPSQRRVPDASGYLTDPRYVAGPPQPARPDPDEAHDDERDDWYDQRASLALPATRRPAEMVPPRRPARARRVVRDEDVAEPEPGYLAAVWLTTVWYVVPALLYGIWALTLDTTPDPNCVDPAGNPCAPPRTEALNALVHAVPRLATAVSLSLAIALILRWYNGSWRSGAIGFASAVVGAGVTTAIFSLLGV